MFVINYDFSQYHYHFKFLLINIPVVITQLLTYPFQRIQTQLITKKQYITKNQFQEAQLIMRQMIGIQKFPKFYHGIRYSLDYSATQMTTKFFVFDWLMQSSIQKQPGAAELLEQSSNTQSYMKNRVQVYAKCILANTLATLLSQSAFNYQVVASSLSIDSRNRPQSVKQKLITYTKHKKVPFIGLQYTIPITIYNTVLQVFLVQKLIKLFKIGQNPGENYAIQQMISAVSAFILTGFGYHYSYLRQVQLSMDIPKNSLPFSKGLLGTLFRFTLRNSLLYGLYFLWFQHQSKKQAMNNSQIRDNTNKLPTYRH